MNKEEKFWNWFKENSSKYYYLNQITDVEKKEKLLDNFLEQLHDYCKELFFEIGGLSNESQELIITAEGKIEYFPAVERLVTKAPKLNDWEIIAFKPPMGVDFITLYEDIKLNPLEIWFLPLDNENKPAELGLRLCIPYYNSKREKTFLEGCYQVLDVILGEKSVALDIHHVEIDKLPRRPEKEGLIKLSELAKYIAWRKGL